MTERELSNEELKYYTELKAFCPFCKAVHAAEAKVHLDFDSDCMEDHPDWGPIYSLWVVVTCGNCKREIYAREDSRSKVWRDPCKETSSTPPEKGD